MWGHVWCVRTGVQYTLLCMYEHTCVWCVMHACVCTCVVSAHTPARTHVVSTGTHVPMCTCVVSTCPPVCTHIQCVHAPLYLGVHTRRERVYTHICAHVKHMYTCVYTCGECTHPCTRVYTRVASVCTPVPV